MGEPIKSFMTAIRFFSVIRMEGINPYVDPPLDSARKLGRDGGVVPVNVKLDSSPKLFQANLMPLGPKRTRAAKGRHHRLYLHGIMRKAVGKDIGDRIKVELSLDTRSRAEPMNPSLLREMKKDAKAKAVFERFSPSHQKELNRYLNHLKSAEALQRNVDKVMVYLRESRATWFGKKKKGH